MSDEDSREMLQILSRTVLEMSAERDRLRQLLGDTTDHVFHQLVSEFSDGCREGCLRCKIQKELQKP